MPLFRNNPSRSGCKETVLCIVSNKVYGIHGCQVMKHDIPQNYKSDKNYPELLY